MFCSVHNNETQLLPCCPFIHSTNIIGNLDHGFVDRSREDFSVDFGSHEGSSGTCASNQEDPDGTPSKVVLERTDSEQSNGSSDGSASIDQSSDSSQRLVVSTDTGVSSQIGRYGRGNDIVGSEKRQR